MRYANVLVCRDGYRGSEIAMPVATRGVGTEHVLAPRISSAVNAVGTREDHSGEGESTIRGSFVLVGSLFVRTYVTHAVRAFC